MPLLKLSCTVQIEDQDVLLNGEVLAPDSTTLKSLNVTAMDVMELSEKPKEVTPKESEAAKVSVVRLKSHSTCFADSHEGFADPGLARHSLPTWYGSGSGRRPGHLRATRMSKTRATAP